MATAQDTCGDCIFTYWEFIAKFFGQLSVAVDYLWTKRPGIKSEYFEQYFARYLFIKENYEHRHHRFFLAAARIYPPQSTRPAGPRGPAIPLEEIETVEDSEGDSEAGPTPSS